MTKRINASKSVAAPSTQETAPTALSPKTGISLVFLQPPPADAKIPVAPSGAASPSAGNYRAVIPWATELAALPGAVEDLRRFTNFAQVFGVTGLPYAQVLQAFDVGNQWSTMRKETVAWDGFSGTQEGIAWGTIRAMMDRLRPQFEIAAVGDPSLAATFPSLATLFGAKKAIAQKAVATKRLNKAAIARGEEPTHGLVGKMRQKAANRALVAAAKAQAAAAAAGGGAAAPSPAVAPAATAAAPAAVPAPPVAGGNGATH